MFFLMNGAVAAGATLAGVGAGVTAGLVLTAAVHGMLAAKGRG